MLGRRAEIIKAIVVLPGTVLLLIPTIILSITGFTFASKTCFTIYLAIFLLFSGLGLAVWTIKLFNDIGNGTPAPWCPPQHLVVNGPYLYVRNPMITGVLLILMSEFLFFNSLGLGIWCIIFFTANVFYMRYFEEPALIKRFGAEYELYMRNVPRWIPRLTSWQRTE
jgi:protein-S-isoprenylcysteine O-methyltransferase Ste14